MVHGRTLVFFITLFIFWLMNGRLSFCLVSKFWFIFRIKFTNNFFLVRIRLLLLFYDAYVANEFVLIACNYVHLRKTFWLCHINKMLTLYFLCNYYLTQWNLFPIYLNFYSNSYLHFYNLSMQRPQDCNQ